MGSMSLAKLSRHATINWHLWFNTIKMGALCEKFSIEEDNEEEKSVERKIEPFLIMKLNIYGKNIQGL